MAENNEDRSPEDLSDEPSAHRLEDFRKKGQVAQSKELVALFVAIACGLTLFSMAPSIGKQIIAFMVEVFGQDLVIKPGSNMEALVGSRLLQVVKVFSMIGLPIAAVGFFLGIAGHLSQIGFLFTAQPMMPDFEKINPLAGVKRLFSMKNLIETFRVTFKGAVLCWVAYSILKTAILQSPDLLFKHPAAIFDVVGTAGKSLFLSLCGILAIFASVDLFLQKRDFGKQVRVTKQEAKQEAKEQEGDPMVKARIRSIQREMARKRMMSAVKKADVIITNPTHIAIALAYEKDKMVAPRVVAKGADLMAQRIKQIASEAGIPMVENVPLARAMYKSVKVGHIIPKNLFQAVAEVLAYVYKLKNRKF